MDHLNEMKLKLLLKKEQEDEPSISTDIGLNLLNFLSKIKYKLNETERMNLKKFLAETSLFL